MNPITLKDDSPSAEAAVAQARALVGETVAELMGFWNFKPSMGRVWTALYLSQVPLTADEIVTRTGLSVGTVSMTLSDLRAWNVARVLDRQDGRRRYAAETDITAMVTRVFRQREIQLVARCIEQFGVAVKLLDAHGRSSNPSQMMESRFVVTRVQRLLALSRAGQKMLEQLVRVGRMDFGTIKNKLGRSRA